MIAPGESTFRAPPLGATKVPETIECRRSTHDRELDEIVRCADESGRGHSFIERGLKNAYAP
jgi:hypothetical protein